MSISHIAVSGYGIGLEDREIRGQVETIRTTA